MTTQPPTTPQLPNPTPTLLFARGAPCASVGDCGQLGIFGSNLVCAKTGCQNCSVESDCNGVNSPSGKCINNLCSCVSNEDCACEGNDPYGCGHDKGKCVCSEKNKGLAAMRITKSEPVSIIIILFIALFLILAWAVFVTKVVPKFKNLKDPKQYVIGGAVVIGVIALTLILLPRKSEWN